MARQLEVIKREGEEKPIKKGRLVKGSTEKTAAAKFLQGLFRPAASEHGAPRPAREKKVEPVENTEGIEKSEQEIESTNISSLELLTVPGSNGDAINEYLQEMSEKKGKKDVLALSEEEYVAILADKKQFQKWLATRWVESYIASRKEEARVLAEQRNTDREEQSDLYEKEGKKRTEIVIAERQLEREIKERLQKREAVFTGLERQHQKILSDQRIFLEQQGLEDSAILEVLHNLENTLEKNREDFYKKTEEEDEEFASEARTALKKHQEELEALQKENAYKFTKGTKREMVLSVDRWGRALKKIIEKYPEGVKRNEDDGTISLDLEKLQMLAGWEDSRLLLINQLATEVDIAFKSDTAKRNIEALIRTPEEADIALDYLSQLELDPAFDNVNKAERQKYKLVWHHLLELNKSNLFLLLTEEESLIGSERRQGTNLQIETAAPLAKDLLKNGSDLDRVALIAHRIVESAKARIKHAVLGKTNKVAFEQIIETLSELKKNPNIDWKNFFGSGINQYYLRQSLFELCETMNENNVSWLLDETKMFTLLYEFCNKADLRLAVVSGRDKLPEDLERAFLDTDPNKMDYSASAVEQIAVHFRKWRGGREGYRSVAEALKKLKSGVMSKITLEMKSVINELDEGLLSEEAIQVKMQEAVSESFRLKKIFEKRFKVLDSLVS